MVSRFDPRADTDRSAACSRVTHPVGQSGLASRRPKGLQNARNIMQIWEQEVAEFEMQYSKKVKRMISAAKSVMPRMFFGRFRG